VLDKNTGSFYCVIVTLLMAESRKKKATPKSISTRPGARHAVSAPPLPHRILARDEAGYPYVKDPDKCINCGWCEIRCPDFAITVQQRKDEARKVRESFEEEAPEGAAAPGE
jgi:2-oxoglutarate ferredoxin oxidoreductase subunit delta